MSILDKLVFLLLLGVAMFPTVLAADDLSFLNSSTFPNDGQVWGGRGVRLQISAKGASLEFDCAQGLIESETGIGKLRRFDLPGKFANESGGPPPVISVRQEDGTIRNADEGIAWRKVRYIGRIRGRSMRLTVRDATTGAVIGRFRLFPDNPGHLLKCRR
ncbi:MAG TPA: hypothetical protein VJT50_10980 [Pyrinomonadaceae bacterium]|nr:hypothetical protein [Pyrinomonadaceae bacterium]